MNGVIVPIGIAFAVGAAFTFATPIATANWPPDMLSEYGSIVWVLRNGIWLFPGVAMGGAIVVLLGRRRGWPKR